MKNNLFYIIIFSKWQDSFIQVFLSKTLTCRLVNSWLAIMILKTRNQKGFVLTAANLKQSLWLYMTSWSVVGFPGGTSGKEPTCQCRKHKRCRFNPWVGNILWQRAWQPTLVSVPGESHGERSLGGYSPWGCKESDMTDRLSTAQNACDE